MASGLPQGEANKRVCFKLNKCIRNWGNMRLKRNDKIPAATTGELRSIRMLKLM
jgi:hypothetical protein